MSRLQELIHVNTNYTRSINLERDTEQACPVRPYVITTRAKQTLERIANAFRKAEAPRAWALIGPYGAGKSAFGLFLTHLLSISQSGGSRYARQVLRQADEQLYGKYLNHQRRGQGLCCIALTGSPEPLAQRLLGAMLAAAETFFGGRLGRNPKVITEIRTAISTGTHSVSDVVQLLTKLQESVARGGGRGVLLVIDELGKFLEYEARHRGATDIFLLQALAEHSVRPMAAPLLLVVLLHQAIELYAQSLGEQLKNEWKKVQGRFETIPFLESTEQTLRVMKVAISAELPKAIRSRLRAETTEYAKRLADLGALPIGLSASEAQMLFARCYPLHPVALLILPTLCQRVAQNERTLFSYLGSHEPHGFLDSMSRLDVYESDRLPWIKPHEIYEYFILNQPGLLSDQATHRRWAEVVTALERLGDAPTSEAELLKTIGLLNIIGAQGGLKASNEVLNLCAPNVRRNGAGAKAARALVQRSIITYRRFNHEYRVWQGSDFDLDTALRHQRVELGTIDSSDVLNELLPLPAIVARRHGIETGTLRFFSPIFVTAATLTRIAKSEHPILYVCLSESSAESDILRATITNLGVTHSPAVISTAGALIKDAIAEVLALRRIQRQSPELANDPAAQRELRDRLAAAVKAERELIGAILEEPERADWIIGGLPTVVRSKRQLQVKLSELLDQIYSKAPIIRNELVNRDRPSATAIAARKKLLVAMLEQAKAEDLDIHKFPAEKAMYRAVLRATGLHAFREGQWQFQSPVFWQEDPARIAPMWGAVLELLDRANGTPVSLAYIYEVLSKPPYGIKAGVLPILMLAFFQAMRQELALVESGQFVPFVTMEVLESLLKDAGRYAFQRFRLDSGRNELLSRYAEAITGEFPDEANLISVLQPLAKLMVGLPDYTKQTKKLSASAVAVRDLFFASKTPVDLIFSQLPAAVGVELEMSANHPDKLKLFGERFRSALAELRVAYHALLRDVIDLLKVAFALDPKLTLDELRAVLHGRCTGLESYTIDPQCTAFIGRLVDAHGDETQWLLSLATFLVRKPPEKWIDDDLDAAKYRLTELAARVRDLRQLQLHYEDARLSKHGDLEASLIRIISTRDGERQALITLDEQGRSAVQGRALEIRNLLRSLPTDELKLAALAQAVRDLITPASAAGIGAVEANDKGAA